ncbi:MAG TPA: hypothetical protein DHV29_12960 [Bacteroidales bacterium]|nr:hypothetical protein [Bacteroidales bacterium]HCY24386.1 hypothetical protein [Bacteroidales bacterium]
MRRQHLKLRLNSMKLIYIFTLLTAFLFANNIQAQTTVMAGDWSNPLTWGGAPPMGTGTVVINHAVNLDLDYMHSSGSITINGVGSLSSTNPMRVFALNYPSGVATMTVNGSFSVARVLFTGGYITNNGTFTIDSLFNTAHLDNGVNGIINAEQFMNGIDGNFSNYGSVNSTNFYSQDSVKNYGTITTNDFCNSDRFINYSAAEVNANHDFSNIDSLSGPVSLTNDGQINVGNNWHNSETLDGSGKWCVVNNTWNNGIMNGTFDFCDQSGGNIDLEEGTVAGTVTFCSFSCNVSIAETSTEIGISPNPCQNEIVFSNIEAFDNALLTIVNSFGQIVIQSENLNGNEITIESRNLSAGIYFVTIKDGNQIFSGKFIKD